MVERFPRVPKVRQRAELFMADGTRLEGHVFVEATSRIQDVLNRAERFFPFVDDAGDILLINRSQVVKVRPSD